MFINHLHHVAIHNQTYVIFFVFAQFLFICIICTFYIRTSIYLPSFELFVADIASVVVEVVLLCMEESAPPADRLRSIE